jgi:hypothetical protein
VRSSLRIGPGGSEGGSGGPNILLCDIRLWWAIDAIPWKLSIDGRGAAVLRGKRGKGCFDLLIAAAIENDKTLSQRVRRFLHVPDLHLSDRLIWVHQQRYDLYARNQVAQ